MENLLSVLFSDFEPSAGNSVRILKDLSGGLNVMDGQAVVGQAHFGEFQSEVLGVDNEVIGNLFQTEGAPDVFQFADGNSLLGIPAFGEQQEQWMNAFDGHTYTMDATLDGGWAVSDFMEPISEVTPLMDGSWEMANVAFDLDSLNDLADLADLFSFWSDLSDLL